MHARNLINKIAYCNSVLPEKWDIALLPFVIRNSWKIIVLVKNVDYPTIFSKFRWNLLICYPHQIHYAIKTSNYHICTLYILQSGPNLRGIALIQIFYTETKSSFIKFLKLFSYKWSCECKTNNGLFLSAV